MDFERWRLPLSEIARMTDIQIDEILRKPAAKRSQAEEDRHKPGLSIPAPRGPIRFLEPDGTLLPQEEWVARMREAVPDDPTDWPKMWRDIRAQMDAKQGITHAGPDAGTEPSDGNPDGGRAGTPEPRGATVV